MNKIIVMDPTKSYKLINQSECVSILSDLIKNLSVINCNEMSDILIKFLSNATSKNKIVCVELNKNKYVSIANKFEYKILKRMIPIVDKIPALRSYIKRVINNRRSWLEYEITLLYVEAFFDNISNRIYVVVRKPDKELDQFKKDVKQFAYIIIHETVHALFYSDFKFAMALYKSTLNRYYSILYTMLKEQLGNKDLDYRKKQKVVKILVKYLSMIDIANRDEVINLYKTMTDTIEKIDYEFADIYARLFFKKYDMYSKLSYITKNAFINGFQFEPSSNCVETLFLASEVPALLVKKNLCSSANIRVLERMNEIWSS